MSSKFKAFRPFEEARSFARSLRFKGAKEWELYRQGKLTAHGPKPDDIPSLPDITYREQWIDWLDWLGNQRQTWLGFEEARSFARSLELPGQKAWKRYTAGGMPHLPPRPKNIPTAPDSVYADDGWVNYGDWLGTGNTKFRRVTPRDFHAAREFAHSLGLSKPSEWKLFASNKLTGFQTRPLDIPSEPQKTYADTGWAGWDDWLGRA